MKASTTIDIQPEKKEEDAVIPMIGGDMSVDELKANFNALLYMLTEQMAVNLKILDLLVQKDFATAEEINEKVLSVTGDKEQLTVVYNELFSRFVGYYTSIRQLLEQGKTFDGTDTNSEENVGVPNE